MSPFQECHDCGATPGKLHVLGCDVERCPYCGNQMISCGHLRSDRQRPPDDDRIPWTGRWPGEEECEQWGWYAQLIPGKGWVPCDKVEPNAQPDLNRLYVQARWDRANKKWVKRRRKGARKDDNGRESQPS